MFCAWLKPQHRFLPLSRPSDDHFMQIMCIRKGKRLVARIVPFLSPEQAADVLMATARNLPFLIKKDAQDEVRSPTREGLDPNFLFLAGKNSVLC